MRQIAMVEMITVGDIMSTEIVSISADATVRDAAKLLIEKGISSLAVMDSGELVGIVTDRDFVKLATAEIVPENVRDIMSKNIVTIRPDEEVLEAVRLMGKSRIRHLLVKDDVDPVGIVSLRDVLKIEPDAIYGYISQRKLNQ
ncbi:MAG: CBS domain-containing protein [Candidatus Hydrothermarchaeales archaeon]